MSRHWLYVRFLQIILDVLGIFLAFVIAYFVRVGWIFSSDFPFGPYVLTSFLATAVWIGLLLVAKYYRLPPRSGKRQLFDLLLSIFAGGVAISVVLVVFLFQRAEVFSRALTLMSFFFGVAFLFITREMTYALFRSFKKKEKKLYRTLLVGANRISEKLAKDLTSNPYAPYKVVGVIDPYGIAKKFQGATILGKLNKLEEVCEKEKVSALIQCDAFEHTLSLISFCQEKDIKFQFDPALRGVQEDNLRIREVAGNTLISWVDRDHDGIGHWWSKLKDGVLRQVFDID